MKRTLRAKQRKGLREGTVVRCARRHDKQLWHKRLRRIGFTLSLRGAVAP